MDLKSKSKSSNSDNTRRVDQYNHMTATAKSYDLKSYKNIRQQTVSFNSSFLELTMISI